MGKMHYEWAGGESLKTPGKIVDYMRVTDEDGREILYAESEWIDTTEESPQHEQEEEQFRIFWDCLGQLAVEAGFKGVDLREVNIPWDHYGSPTEHFDSIRDVPAALSPYLERHFQ